MPARGMQFLVDQGLLGWGISVGFLIVENFDNNHQDERLAKLRNQWAQDFVRSTRLDAVVGDTKITGYRELHARAGCSHEKLVPSPESLYPILFRDSALRTINPLVDIYNWVALKFGVSCGAHDVAALHGRISLQRFDGDMTYIPLGRRKPESVPAGEYGYVNGAGELLCRLECKQAAFSAVSGNTTSAVVIVQGHAGHDASTVGDTLDAIQQGVTMYCAGAPSFHRECFAGARDETWGRVANGAGIR